jgi:hypothetical protein
MHLLCPHCHGPIELIDLSSREVICPSCGSSFQLQRSSTTDWRPQRRLGKFEILNELGIGAFGMVYKGRGFPRFSRGFAFRILISESRPRPKRSLKRCVRFRNRFQTLCLAREGRQKS